MDSNEGGETLRKLNHYFIFQQLLKVEIICSVVGCHILAIDEAQKAAELRMISDHWGTETGEVESRTIHGVIRGQDAGKAFCHRIHVAFVPFQKMTRLVPHSVDFVGSIGE